MPSPMPLIHPSGQVAARRRLDPPRENHHMSLNSSERALPKTIAQLAGAGVVGLGVSALVGVIALSVSWHDQVLWGQVAGCVLVAVLLLTACSWWIVSATAEVSLLAGSRPRRLLWALLVVLGGAATGLLVVFALAQAEVGWLQVSLPLVEVLACAAVASTMLRSAPMRRAAIVVLAVLVVGAATTLAVVRLNKPGPYDYGPPKPSPAASLTS
jgi:hypothetical protein